MDFHFDDINDDKAAPELRLRVQSEKLQRRWRGGRRGQEIKTDTSKARDRDRERELTPNTAPVRDFKSEYKARLVRPSKWFINCNSHACLPALSLSIYLSRSLT